MLLAKTTAPVGRIPAGETVEVLDVVRIFTGSSCAVEMLVRSTRDSKLEAIAPRGSLERIPEEMPAAAPEFDGVGCA